MITNLTTHTKSCDDLACYPYVIFHVAAVITTILAVFGATGNILTVLVILFTNLRVNINNMFVCNLSFADFLYCSIVLPLQAEAFYNRAWTLNEAMCKIYASLRVWLAGVNMLLLCCIAINRYLHEVHCESDFRLSKRHWYISAGIVSWALPLLFSLTPLFGWWGAFAFNERTLQCINTFNVTEGKSHKATTIPIGYLIPCFVICLCYFRILRKALEDTKRATRKKGQVRTQSEMVIQIADSSCKIRKMSDSSYKTTCMMALVVYGFILGTTLYFILNTVDSKTQYPMVHMWVPFIAWLMYGLNPVIYTIMDTNFQLAYRRLILGTTNRTKQRHRYVMRPKSRKSLTVYEFVSQENILPQKNSIPQKYSAPTENPKPQENSLPQKHSIPKIK